jgi:hypothetical protein
MDFAQEIIDLHRFFEAWFRGEEADFSRFESVTHPEMTFISPGGEVIERGRLLGAIQAGRGNQPTLRIWIENPVLRYQSSEGLLATYEEWQECGGETRSRITSVWFVLDDAAPHGLVWRHVHETYF